MAEIRWGYAINQWRNTEVDLVRQEQRESALKVISVCGFTGVEITNAAIGGPELVNAYFGSIHKFLDFVHSCGVDRVCSFFADLGGDPGNPEDHPRMVESAKVIASFLQQTGGKCLVVRPIGSYWKEAPSLIEKKITTVGDCWSKVGKATREVGIDTVLHPDFLCAIHDSGDIDKILQASDPTYVGLAIDTAELAIAGVDPGEVYERHADRVRHFHFKDACFTDTLAEYKIVNAEVQLLNGGGKREIERWFFEMGTHSGLVDFRGLMKSIKQHNYDGWIVVESDQSPHVEESCMLNGWYVRQVLSKVV